MHFLRNIAIDTKGTSKNLSFQRINGQKNRKYVAEFPEIEVFRGALNKIGKNLHVVGKLKE